MTRETDPAFHKPSLAIAVSAAAATCAVALPVFGLLYSGKFAGLIVIVVLPVYFLCALVVAVAIGLPMLLILRSLGLVNLWTTLLVGAVLGAAVGWIALQDDWIFDVVGWTVGGTVGAWAGRYAWFWSQRRYANRQLNPAESRNFMQ